MDPITLLCSRWSPVSLNIDIWPISDGGTILSSKSPLNCVLFERTLRRQQCGNVTKALSIYFRGVKMSMKSGKANASDQLMLSVSWWERSQQTLANDRRLTSHAADVDEVELTTAEDAKRWDAKEEEWKKGVVLLAEKQSNKNKQDKHWWKINKSCFAFKMTWEWEHSRNSVHMLMIKKWHKLSNKWNNE